MSKKFDKKFHKKVGDKIRFYRERKGLTQEQLSFEVANSNSYAGIVENALRDVPLSKIHKIAQVLGVEPWKLLKID